MSVGAHARPVPSVVRIGFSRVLPELKMFYRRPEQMILTFSMPAVICLLLGSIFSEKLPVGGVSTGSVIAASMLAYGILSTSFVNLGISIAADRDTGALRRLRGTPTTATSYFIGKIMLVLIVSLLERARGGARPAHRARGTRRARAPCAGRRSIPDARRRELECGALDGSLHR